MTISSTTRVAGPYTGNGSTATFPFAFKVFEASDLDVVTLDVATGAIATLTLTADYTVALNADQDTSPGGSITLTAGNLAAGITLTMTTDMEELQGVDLTNGGAFYPDTINEALDTLTILVQQLAEQLGRALQLPVTDTGANVTLPSAYGRTSKALGFDVNGNLAMVPLPVVGGPIPLSPAEPGYFQVAHNLPFTPTAVVVQMTSGGQIWLQPASFDSEYIYLVASDAGVTGVALCIS